jgi:hypothetical protein
MARIENIGILDQKGLAWKFRHKFCELHLEQKVLITSPKRLVISPE